ncbi:uncharacterized protein LOC114521440 [Dendronephthya gigantea]|uniref:uncharacterized protein LOC114521440 n=1 Tax=Dendronephthya gigantea TaxID=151771 RepID=UPI00106A7CA5|nr:uncharacterized protein LOC114521440 [Dendronephthya gigantea]
MFKGVYGHWFTKYSWMISNYQVLKRSLFRPSQIQSIRNSRLLQEQDSHDVSDDITTVEKFNSKRQYENRDSLCVAQVISFPHSTAIGHVQLNDFVFGTNPRLDILHRVVVWQRANARAGTACVKDRSEVRGGGRKPWPQKGLGKARQGSIRAPQWRGGGVVHGPKPKSFSYTLPKKVRRMGLRVALTCRFRQGDLFVVDSLSCNSLSNNEIANIFDKNNWNSVLVVDSEPNENLRHAVESFGKAEMHNTISLNVYSILNHDKIVLSLNAIEQLEERLCKDNRPIWR